MVSNFKFSGKLEHILQKSMPIALSVTLAMGISGCTSEKESDSTTVTSTEVTSAETNEVSEESNMVIDAYEKSMEADTRVEQSITGTMELAKSISEATDEYRNTEQYKQDVERLKTEFDTLVNWLLGKTEIDGYTVKDVGTETVDLAKDALSYMDGVIESYIPDYKDKAKEKLSELGDFLWDKGTDFGAYLLNKGEEFANDVKEKSKEM